MIADGPLPGEARLLPLRGGRRLAFSDIGDAQGDPVVYCHGFPSSRREALLLEPTARGCGVRILAPDRPGCGDSDHQPGRGLDDWAGDVAALADHLGLARFAVLGVSGGAPYALACAWRLPTRVSACALVCPLGPVYLGEILSAMAWPSRLLLGSAQRAPWVPPLLFGGLVALARPEVKAILGAAVRDAMQHGARGALEDVRLYTSPWGIPLHEIQHAVHLWHGESDGTVPIAHAHWYEQHLSRPRAHYLPAEGHYSLPLRHAGAILASLVETET
ncbi:MAG: alpha/beta fold hydrolase [Chromatiaceae bacterium]